MAETEEFEIDRRRLAAYILQYWRRLLFFCPLFWLPWAKGWARRHAEAKRYALEGTNLRLDGGLGFVRRCTIPLDSVTAVVLFQGPLMRRCGIWGLYLRTAGTGQAAWAAAMYALRDPEGVRDRLLAARDEARRSTFPPA